MILDAFVVMPDHVHLLFGIAKSDEPETSDHRRRGIPAVCPYPDGAVPRADSGGPARKFSKIQRGTVASVMRQYKSIVTKRVWKAEGRGIGPVWQRGYYDRVVRSGREAEAIRRYVAENPARWPLRDGRADGHRV